MNQLEITLLISFGVLIVVFIFLNVQDTLSPKKGLSIVTCLLLYWCGYAIYKTYSAKEQIEQLEYNIKSSLNQIHIENPESEASSESAQPSAGSTREMNNKYEIEKNYTGDSAAQQQTHQLPKRVPRVFDEESQ